MTDQWQAKVPGQAKIPDTGLLNHKPGQRQKRWFEILALIAILLSGTFLRVLNLAGPDFGADEYYHVFGALAILQDGTPVLPSGYLYERARLWTEIIALAARITPLDEASARAPAVIVGVFNILLVYGITRRWFGPGAALVTAFLIAFSPMEIAASRQVRMYTLLQFTLLSFSYFFLTGIAAAPVDNGGSTPKGTPLRFIRHLQVNFLALLVAAGFLLLSVHLQRLTFIAASGPVFFILFMGSIYLFSSNQSFIKLKYVGSAVVIILVIVGSYVVAQDWVLAQFEQYRYAPLWAAGSVNNWRFYTYLLQSEYPFFFTLYFVSIVFAFSKNKLVSLYLFLCFFLPLVILSLAAWKAERFILILLPLMLIPIGVMLAYFVRSLNEIVLNIAKHSPFRHLPSSILMSATGVILVLTVVTAPWFTRAIKVYNIDAGGFASVAHFNWQRALGFVEERAGPTEPVISSRTLPIRFYAPTLTRLYSINASVLEQTLKFITPDEKGRFVDYEGGGISIRSLPELDAVIKENRCGWFITERQVFLSGPTIPKPMKDFIIEYTTEIEMPEARDMIVRRWGVQGNCEARKN